MSPTRSLNVTPLDLYRNRLTERQGVITAFAKTFLDMPAQDIPTAGIAFTVLVNGKIRITYLQVEPEHVMPILSAMRDATSQLEGYLAGALTGQPACIDM